MKAFPALRSGFTPEVRVVGNIDWIMVFFAVVAFLVIGVGLTWIILLCHSLFAPHGRCVIHINTDPDLTRTVEAGVTLLHALTKDGIAIPCPCGGRATCHQCRLQIVERPDPPLDTDVSAFTRGQLKEGWRLSCQVRLSHDLGVKIPEHLLHVKEMTVTVISNNNVATFIKELVVRLPSGEKMDYHPGGYAQILIPPFITNTADWKTSIDPKFLPDWERYGMLGQQLNFLGHKEEPRGYSFASYPAEGGRLMFNIRIATAPLEGGRVSKTIPWGFGSSYLFSLKPGDTVRITGPYGESFMREGSNDVYFLIGGAGSSFGRSHIQDLFRTKNTKRTVAMWYGARSLQENIYQHEYEELVKKFPNFSYHLVLSEPTKEDIDAGWPAKDPLQTAFLFKAFEAGALKNLRAPEDNLYYVCGPPMHNKSVMKLLDDYGVPRENIVLDDFGN
jgi:Na+-transporting NADH:ubiquinone oxidoreductase subunit F